MGWWADGLEQAGLCEWTGACVWTWLHGWVPVLRTCVCTFSCAQLHVGLACVHACCAATLYVTLKHRYAQLHHTLRSVT